MKIKDNEKDGDDDPFADLDGSEVQDEQEVSENPRGSRTTTAKAAAAAGHNLFRANLITPKDYVNMNDVGVHNME